MAVKQGETGEICIAGPQVMTGYWNKPQDTEDCFVGRFFRTGDVGYMDKDGYIFIVDRIKDMINASGFKIYPRRIEDALYEHPSVAEVVVVGIPDTYRGEAPKAFVKLKEGRDSTTAAELLHFLKEKLSKLSCPRNRVPRDLPRRWSASSPSASCAPRRSVRPRSQKVGTGIPTRSRLQTRRRKCARRRKAGECSMQMRSARLSVARAGTAPAAPAAS